MRREVLGPDYADKPPTELGAAMFPRIRELTDAPRAMSLAADETDSPVRARLDAQPPRGRGEPLMIKAFD